MAGGLIDPNLSYAWTAQQAAGSTNLYGQAGLGYGTNAPVASPNATFGTAPNNGQGGGLALAGTGLYNAGNANANALYNAGYSDNFPLLVGVTLAASNSNGTATPLAPAMVSASGHGTNNANAVQNPVALACQVVITAGTSTAVFVAPFISTGVANATFYEVSLGDTSTTQTVVVPPAGWIYITYSVVPTGWTWTTIL